VSGLRRGNHPRHRQVPAAPGALAHSPQGRSGRSGPRGGPILIWHGLADELIFPQGTIQYYQRVQDTLGSKNTATFARLFIAPGAAHCAPGAGPAPANPLQDVVNWVEHGQAPATILATGGTRHERPMKSLKVDRLPGRWWPG
jgi:fermentation-respiration switch protein FrsA (DUF1100 family)